VALPEVLPVEVVERQLQLVREAQPHVAVAELRDGVPGSLLVLRGVLVGVQNLSADRLDGARVAVFQRGGLLDQPSAELLLRP
jgi:hypothetical protein